MFWEKLWRLKYFVQNIESIYFYSRPQPTLPQVFIITYQAEEKYPFSPDSIL